MRDKQRLILGLWLILLLVLLNGTGEAGANKNEDKIAQLFAKAEKLYKESHYTGIYSEMIACMDQVLQLNAKSSKAYMMRGQGYLYQGLRQWQGMGGNKDQGLKDMNQALQDFTAAIKLEPKNDVYYIARGDLYKWRRKEGDNEKMEADYTKAIALNPSIRNYYTRGIAYKNHCDSGFARGFVVEYRQKAESDFKKGLAIMPKNTNDYIYRASILSMGFNDIKEVITTGYKNMTEILAEYEKALKIRKPTDKYAAYCIYVGRGECYQFSKQYEQAIADYEQAITLGEELGEDTSFYRQSIGMMESMQQYEKEKLR